MLVLGVNKILKWCQITTGGRRYNKLLQSTFVYNISSLARVLLCSQFIRPNPSTNRFRIGFKQISHLLYTITFHKTSLL